MNGTKEKIKKFVNERENQLMIVGGIVAVVAGGILGGKCLKKAYLTGVAHGSIAGIADNIEWFDEHFPDLGLEKLYATYAETHPEDMISLATFVKEIKKR